MVWGNLGLGGFVDAHPDKARLLRPGLGVAVHVISLVLNSDESAVSINIAVFTIDLVAVPVLSLGDVGLGLVCGHLVGIGVFGVLLFKISLVLDIK